MHEDKDKTKDNKGTHTSKCRKTQEGAENERKRTETNGNAGNAGKKQDNERKRGKCETVLENITINEWNSTTTKGSTGHAG
jgi:hypothetical protein